MIAPTSDMRIPPLEPPYDETTARTLERMMGGPGVPPLLLFRTIAHNPALLDKLRSTGSYLLNFGAIDPVDREIVILRTCARCGCEYEWGVHVAVYGEAVGLSSEQIDATVTGASAPWTDRQLLLVRLVDELHETAAISDDLWGSLDGLWRPDQIVELVTLVGQYHAVSFVANALRLPNEDFAPAFSAGRRTL